MIRPTNVIKTYKFKLAFIKEIFGYLKCEMIPDLLIGQDQMQNLFQAVIYSS